MSQYNTAHHKVSISTRFYTVLALLYCTWSSLPLVPHSIAVENISVVVTAVSNILNIYSGVSLHPLVSFVCMHSSYSTNNETTVQVNTLCTSRIPEFFLITLMNSAGRVLKESNTSHDPGQEVANFNISPPQRVDVCTLHVRIRAGNSAGISSYRAVTWSPDRCTRSWTSPDFMSSTCHSPS